MTDLPHSRLYGARAALVLAVAAVALMLYAPSWSHPFVYDDVTAVRDHPLVRGERPWRDILTSPYRPADVSPDPLYRPLTIATFRINYLLAGEHPAGYHVTNSALHACVSVLIALLACRLWRRTAAGWIAGLLFATHPVHAEAVVPLVGRSELLAALFILWALHAHLGHVLRGLCPSITHHLAMTALYAAACASKEHAVLAIVPIAAVDCWARGQAVDSGCTVGRRVWWRQRLRSHYLGMLAVLIVWFTTRWMLFGRHTTLPAAMIDPLLNPLAGADPISRWATPPALAALAVVLAFWPAGLCPVWGLGGFDLPSTFARIDVIVGIAIAAAGLVLCGAALRRSRRLTIPLSGLIAFMLLPCHVLSGANWLFAERWLYAPLAMAVLAASGVARVAPRRAVAASVLVSALLGSVAWRYQDDWRSDLALMTAVLRRQPDNAVALAGLCALYDRDGRVEAAAGAVDRLVRRHPGLARTWYYRTKLLVARGAYDQARGALDRYVAIAGPAAAVRDTAALQERIAEGRRRR